MDAHDKAEIKDSVEITKETSPFEPERFEYEVLSEVGLFKNGVQYNKGDKVLLDEKTAANFHNPEVFGEDFEPVIKRVEAK